MTLNVTNLNVIKRSKTMFIISFFINMIYFFIRFIEMDKIKSQKWISHMENDFEMGKLCIQSGLHNKIIF